MAAKDQTIFSSLPSDPDDQLEVGFRVISHAYRQKIQALEFEVANMKQFSKEKQNQVAALERRCADMELEVSEAHQRVKDLQDANSRLSSDKTQLEQTVQRQSRELGRLEMFKKSIIRSINDDGTPMDGSKLDQIEMNIPSIKTSPTGSPLRSRPQSPPRSTYGGDISQATVGADSSRPISPSKFSGGLNLVDGKDFFRQARVRLSYDQFNKFLTNIKNLNNHMQTREETLAKAKDIFGPESEDLYITFRNLLSRHGVA